MPVGSTNEPRRIVMLTEGYPEPITAKTGVSVMRYCPGDVVAVFDRGEAGKTAGELFGVGGSVPVIGRLEDAPTANTLMIGIAPPGGRIPATWRPVILEAIQRGMHIVSGLHQFLAEDVEFSEAARKHGAKLTDVRYNEERDVANRRGIREDCLRIHTVGNDCSCGKMVTSIEVANGLRRHGQDAQFVATGQTGIMIAGSGCPIDRVISDFVNGSAEKLVLENQQHDILVIEGQGTLAHPRYSCVTLGLLHGSMPHGLIMCYEVGRTHFYNMDQISLVGMKHLIHVYETMANLMNPCRVIGIAMNSRLVSAAEAEAERSRVKAEFGLPVCDVYRHGPDDLVHAVMDLRSELFG